MNSAEDFIRYSLKIGSIRLIPKGIKLRSGRISPYFFHSGLFNTGESVLKLGRAYLEKIPRKTEIFFGPAYKGISIAIATAIAASERYGKNFGVAFNRKEEKDHGEGGIIVGSEIKEKKVCIVDDVITTGSSSGEAVKIIQENGGTPIACVIAFDRQERGIDTKRSAVQEFERNYNIPVFSVATIANLIEVLEKDAKSDDSTIPNARRVLEKILRYRDKYGYGTR